PTAHFDTSVVSPLCPLSSSSRFPYTTLFRSVVLGQDTCRHPFRIKGLVGQSAMSYGALGNRAITALSTGLRLAGGTWMNTGEGGDRKSTRLNSSHVSISYAVFCLTKKNLPRR